MWVNPSGAPDIVMGLGHLQTGDGVIGSGRDGNESIDPGLGRIGKYLLEAGAQLAGYEMAVGINHQVVIVSRAPVSCRIRVPKVPSCRDKGQEPVEGSGSSVLEWRPRMSWFPLFPMYHYHACVVLVFGKVDGMVPVHSNYALRVSLCAVLGNESEYVPAIGVHMIERAWCCGPRADW
jgi:hypothetical protein